MIAWLMRYWRERQRRIDIRILWPVCKREASDVATARQAFLVHATMDPAWSDLDEQEILRRVMALE